MKTKNELKTALENKGITASEEVLALYSFLLEKKEINKKGIKVFFPKGASMDLSKWITSVLIKKEFLVKSGNLLKLGEYFKLDSKFREFQTIGTKNIILDTSVEACKNAGVEKGEYYYLNQIKVEGIYEGKIYFSREDDSRVRTSSKLNWKDIPVIKRKNIQIIKIS